MGLEEVQATYRWINLLSSPGQRLAGSVPGLVTSTFPGISKAEWGGEDRGEALSPPSFSPPIPAGPVKSLSRLYAKLLSARRLSASLIPLTCALVCVCMCVCVRPTMSPCGQGSPVSRQRGEQTATRVVCLTVAARRRA